MKIVNGKETLVAISEKSLQELNNDLELAQKNLGEIQGRVIALLKDGDGRTTKANEPTTKWDAEYSKKSNGFLCLHCGTNAVYGTAQIVTHLQVKHKIAPDAQHIDGWNDNFEAEYQKSLNSTTKGQQRSNGKGD